MHGDVCLLTVSKEALVVLDSSGALFFPIKTFLRFFLTSLLKIIWKKKMKTPCERKQEMKRRIINTGARKTQINTRARVRIIEWLAIADVDQRDNLRFVTCRQLKTANR